ncbi:hypothetical protein CMI45_02360 [Candidatus Pacearchaeota archaeon]|nr:hypothetical protein [Candidatus Pacearchaeota archaeon]|tara:strand:+ start:101 stop:874 length:774 start_codon:yes stop_codon:yes gene_type:complete
MGELYGVIVLKGEAMKKIIAMAIIMSLMMPAVFAGTERIYPSDDSYVRGKSSERNNNFGTSQDLKAGFQSSWGDQESFLKFDLSSLAGEEITGAELSFDITSITDNPVVELHSVESNNWNENTITWNNKPSVGSLISSKSINGLGRVGYDVTSNILGETGDISFALVEDGGDGFAQSFSKEFFFEGSDEDKERWPFLEIEFEGGQECNTEADIDCNGCVDLLEIVGTMLDYKQGNPDLDLLGMVNIMLQYKGGEISC